MQYSVHNLPHTNYAIVPDLIFHSLKELRFFNLLRKCKSFLHEQTDYAVSSLEYLLLYRCYVVSSTCVSR